MNDFKQRLTSRKFLLALGAILTSLGAGLSGQMDWAQVILAIVVSALGYIGIEGAADVERAKWTNANAPVKYVPPTDPDDISTLATPPSVSLPS